MRLLIAYDGSPASHVAFDDLTRAGLPERCEAVVLSAADVWRPGDFAGAGPAGDPYVLTVAQLRVLAEEALESARVNAAAGRDRLAALFPAWEVRAEAAADSPARLIVEYAEKFDADLVVIGTQGRGAFGRAVFGSVTTRVLDKSHRGVRVARAPRQRAELRVVVGVDGSPDSDAALREVRGRHWPAGTKLRVVTAANWRLLTAPLCPPVSPDELVEKCAEVLVKRACEQLDGAGLDVSQAIRPGSAKRVLVSEAESWEADCLFVGARGLTRAERWLVGSVSTAVAVRAPCSVEVVHAR